MIAEFYCMKFVFYKKCMSGGNNCVLGLAVKVVLCMCFLWYSLTSFNFIWSAQLILLQTFFWDVSAGQIASFACNLLTWPGKALQVKEGVSIHLTLLINKLLLAGKKRMFPITGELQSRTAGAVGLVLHLYSDKAVFFWWCSWEAHSCRTHESLCIPQFIKWPSTDATWLNLRLQALWF